MASVKVAVRVRPFNKREINMDSKCIIEMEGKRTSILNFKLQTYGSTVEAEEHLGRERVKDFFFDHSYWSFDESSPNFTNQQAVYQDLGTGVVKSADEGYNACIFAYGQTGSGKTHTMMGQQGNEGLIPRICENLFQQIHEKEDEGVSFRTEVSYLEIYNEKVRDLLRPQHKPGKATHTLKVREHPKEGPYVQGLTKHLVSDYAAIEAIMKQGNELRTTASTNMNDTSSRSHAIFTVSYTQAKFLHNMPSETTSKINLVDLAGSERADSTGATGVRLKEGANINKSLVTLGSVISSLAEASTNVKKKNLFIPYRDSVLTWLLKDSLGGNSKTIMIATISPADVNYAETLSTLRYANRAKNIINKPTVNEDANVKLIRELRAEIDKLKSMMGQEALSDAEKAAAQKLHENEERLGVLTDKWKDRWKEMQKIMQERELAFKNRLDAGIRMESELPHLVALEDDLLSTGILLYHLKEGKTFVGTESSKTKPDIVINSPNILNEHCVIINNDGLVVLEPFPDAACSVNGVDGNNKKVRLQQGDVVILGKTSIFRFNHPKEAEELREKRKSLGPGFDSLQLSTKFRSESDLLQKMRSVEREKREDHLERQLEEARLLLEKQKQEEEKKLEETKNEFTRQIREESRRLQETRAELELQRRARLQEANTPAQIKKHLQELQKRHVEAEEKRAQREYELIENIERKTALIDVQQNKLHELQTKLNEIVKAKDSLVLQEVETFCQQRANETTKLSSLVQLIVDKERARDENFDLEELNSKWKQTTERILTQEKVFATLSSELQLLISEYEQSENISDEKKLELEAKKEELKKNLASKQSQLEEMYDEKTRTLRKYQQDYKNRFEIMCWEREMIEQKYVDRKKAVESDQKLHQIEFQDTQTKLDEVKAIYFNAMAEENEKLAAERYKVDQRRKEAMKKSIEDQREFNNKVQQYRSILKTGQDRINTKKKETEAIRKELTELMKVKNNDTVKQKIDVLRLNLNDKIEDIHELENNLSVVKKEEEKVIQAMLRELNRKKVLNENEAELSEKLLAEFEKVSREKILLLQEDVDLQEKSVLNCQSNMEKDDEKLKELNKLRDSDSAKLDTELLYIAYLIEKDSSNLPEQNSENLDFIKSSKVALEKINLEYKNNIENIQKDAEASCKNMINERENSQIVLEDLVRARGITEVTLTELKEQFTLERKEELEQIESLRDRLADFEEERNLSNACSENEIQMDTQNHSEENGDISDSNISFQEILMKEKHKLEDEMYEKILSMEKVMQGEIDHLKQREMELIQCLQEDREKLVDEKNTLEKTSESKSDRLKELETLLEEKDDELEMTKAFATREIEELHEKLTGANKEIYALQEKLEKYVSMTSLTLANHNEEDLMSDSEVNQLLMRVNESSGIEEEDEEISRLRISPPPTPVHRFLQSVNLYKKNQIKVSIPKFVLRGMGRNSYHVFEVKLVVGEDRWSVYRRYRRFRELHRQVVAEYPIVHSLEFPSKRYFGNRAETFVRVRRAQLEAYLTAFIAIMSNINTCPIYAVTDKALTKQDLGHFHPFFKQGVYEYTREYTKLSDGEFSN